MLRFVSIRHTGINIGQSDGNEIQGLTLGGVGRGTVLEYIESYSSGDDGVEFFGGTVDLKYFVSAFNADDAVDWDQGWRGRGQFWFVVQGIDKAGAAAEMDGAGGDEHFEPYAIPTIYNVTYVGAGVGEQPESDQAQMLIFRDNSGGFYHNSIFTDFQSSEGGYLLRIEDVDNAGAATTDSRQRFEAGDLGLTHNIFWSFAAGAGLSDWINAGSDAAFASEIETYLTTHNNVVVDPGLRGIDRDASPSGTMDPRPAGDSRAFAMARAVLPDGGFFSTANFIGAFGRSNWAYGWTALDDLSYLGDISTDVRQVAVALPTGFALRPNYPNPFNPVTTIEFSLDRAQHVRLVVYDILGRPVSVLHEGLTPAGTFEVSFEAEGLTTGLYLYRLEAAEAVMSRKMTFIK